MSNKDPFKGYNFRVDIGGIPFGGYHQVDGLDIDIDVDQIEEGGRNESTIPIPGVAKPRPIRLKRGLTDATQLYDWIKKTIDGINSGNADFLEGASIIQLDEMGAPVRIWNFKNCFPGHWGVGPWSATESGLTHEEVTIYHEGVA